MSALAVFSRYTCLWLAILVLPVLLGCGQEVETGSKSEDGRTVVRAFFWDSPTAVLTRKALRHVTAEFNEAHPNIRVDVEFIPVPEYKKRIFLEMGSDNPPDIFMTWAAGFLETFVAGGKALALDEALANDDEWRQRFHTGAFEQLSVDGHIYAVPNTEVVTALFYNKRIFRDLGLVPPKTFKDMLDMAPVLKSHGYIPLALGNEEPWVGGMLAGVIAERIGGLAPYENLTQGGAGWLDPSYVETGHLLQNMKNVGLFPGYCNTLSYADTVELFVEGKASMIIMGSWVIPFFLQSPAIVADGVGVVPIPKATGGMGSDGTWMGQVDSNLGVSAQSKNKEAALTYLKWFSSPFVQRKLVEATGNLVVADVGDVMPKVSPLTLDLMNLLENKKSMFLFYDVRFGQGIGVAFNQTIKAIIDGVPPEQAFEELEKAIRMARAGKKDVQ